MDDTIAFAWDESAVIASKLLSTVSGVMAVARPVKTAASARVAKEKNFMVAGWERLGVRSDDRLNEGKGEIERDRRKGRLEGCGARWTSEELGAEVGRVLIRRKRTRLGS
jgi:hypothetical protein